MSLYPISLPATRQPLGRLPFSMFARSRLCGGFIVTGASPWPPVDITGIGPGRSAGTAANVNFDPAISEKGIVARYFDDGASRTIAYPTGSPNAQAFTFLARVYLASSAGGAGVVCRTDASSTGSGGSTIPLWQNGGQFDMRVNGTDYTAAGTWSNGRWYDIAVISSAASCLLVVDGNVVINGSAASAGTIEAWLAYGDALGGSTTSGDLLAQYGLWFREALALPYVQALQRNPWALFEDPEAAFFFVSAAGITGIGSIINSNDTFSATGTTTVIGIGAISNANDTTNVSGTTTVVGSGTITNQNNTVVASGSVGGTVTGTATIINQNDTFSATGTTTVIGTATITNTNDTTNASGTTTITGTGSITNVNDTVSAFGTSGAGGGGVTTRLPLTGVGT